MGLLWLGLAAFTVALVVLIWTRWGHTGRCASASCSRCWPTCSWPATPRRSQIVAAAPVSSASRCCASPGRGPAGDCRDPVASDRPRRRDPIARQPKNAAVRLAAKRRRVAAAARGRRACRSRLKPKPPPTPPPVAARAAPSCRPRQSPASDRPRPTAPGDAPTPKRPTPSRRPPKRSADCAIRRRSAEPAAAPRRASGDTRDAPDAAEVYRLRVAARPCGRRPQAGGGSPETEAAVQAALHWLADQPEPDGRWDARRTGPAAKRSPTASSRPDAGLEADTGMTGLALLALLGRRSNPLSTAPIRENVRRGLEYLLANQDTDGNLAGSADRFAAMYCHAMATFALSEAYGMTGDPRLDDAVRRAIGYTVAAQDPYGGGWRYRPARSRRHQPTGLAIHGPEERRTGRHPHPRHNPPGHLRFLQSVASGRSGGLASYRPGEPISRTMTAEALVCWQFLGLARRAPGRRRGGRIPRWRVARRRPAELLLLVLRHAGHCISCRARPGGDGTRPCSAQLLATQRKAAPLAGSWDPDPVWGGYGGRIYSTSLGALCLEVYYRYRD